MRPEPEGKTDYKAPSDEEATLPSVWSAGIARSYRFEPATVRGSELSFAEAVTFDESLGFDGGAPEFSHEVASKRLQATGGSVVGDAGGQHRQADLVRKLDDRPQNAFRLGADLGSPAAETSRRSS